MAAAKKKKQPPFPPPWLRKSISLAWGRGRPVTLTLLAAGTLWAGWYLVWHRVRDHVLSSPGYTVSLQDVQITPPPQWIDHNVRDIRADVFRHASLDGSLSIMDDDLAERIHDAFSSHPWVATVVRVTKQPPGRVKVELEYRRPVCMVEVRDELLPVDISGVLLPADDFSPVERSRYPRLVGVDTAPVGPAGESWGDERVAGGAEIAAALAEVWSQLNLQQIVPSDPLVTGYAEEYTYRLRTAGGTEIFWGRAPSSDALGEPSAQDKVARLKHYATEHGTLEGHDGPQRLDVHSIRLTARPKR